MLDFKRRDILSHSNELAKLMVAFTNTMGGKILVGINDKGNIEGMKAKKEHEEHVVNIARNNCDPPIFPIFEVVKMNSGDVYIITIPRFIQYPHALKTRGGKAYYIRVGTSIREPSPQEMAMLFAGGTIPSIIKPTIVKEENKEMIRWKILMPKSLPNPFSLRLDRMKTIPRKYIESWMLDYPIPFPIKFKMRNDGDEPVNLWVKIYSTNQAIVFGLTEQIRKWVWTPTPHRKTIMISLDKALRIEVPEKGQTKFTFDAIYRPEHAKPLYLKRLVLNYEFNGLTPSGSKFVGGPYRIEIPIV